MPLAEACRKYQDLGLVCFGQHAHAVTIGMLGGCVNNAISLFNVIGMSDEQHKETTSDEGSHDQGQQGQPTGAPASEAKNPFVPEVAKVDLEDVYVDIEDAAIKGILKVPAVGWLALFGVLLCVVAVFFMIVFRSPSLEVETVEVQQLILENKKAKEKEDRKVEAYESTRRVLQQINSCVEGYYAAGEISEKLKYVRHPERVRGMMEDYYQRQPMVTGQLHQLEKYSALDVEKVPFVYARVQMKDSSSHDVLLEQMTDGSFKLDWESEVHYQPLAWDDFISNRPAEPKVMRVAVKPDSFYVFEFRDSQKYDCYQLTTKNSDRYVFGYAVKGSELSIQLRQFFMRVKQLPGVSPEPMMLELRFPTSGDRGNCVHIDRLVAPRWFLVR